MPTSREARHESASDCTYRRPVGHVRSLCADARGVCGCGAPCPRRLSAATGCDRHRQQTAQHRGGGDGVKLAGRAGRQTALSRQLPGVTVKVITHAKPRTTAEDMEKEIGHIVSTDKPALVIWQTGTVDAIRRVDTETFRSAIEDGIEAIQAGNSDFILMNPQYSPRTESMIGVLPYVEAMRFVALQHEVPLFDRFAVMRQWVELGIFDLVEATKKIDTAEQVHQCVAELLADLIVKAAKMTGPAAPDQH
jgi:hypothetical protein